MLRFNTVNCFRTLILFSYIAAFLHWRLFDFSMLILFVALSIHYWLTSIKSLSLALKNISPLNFLICAWIIVVFVGNSLIGLHWDTFNFRWIAGFYLIYLASIEIKLQPQSTFKSLSLLTIIAVASAFIWGYFKTGNYVGPEGRFLGFYLNPNVYGLALALPSAFLISWIASKAIIYKKASSLEILATLMLCATVFLTYSRSSWLGLLLSFIFIMLYFRRSRLSQMISVLAFACLCLFFAFNLLGFKDRILYSLDVNSRSSNGLRLQIWEANFKMFLDHPLFGVGYWQNTKLLPTYIPNMPAEESMAHAHNQYLQILATTGFFGMCIYVAIFSLAVGYFVRELRRGVSPIAKQASIAAISVLLAYLASSLTDSPLDSREPRSFLMLTLGTSLGLIYSSKRYIKDSSPS